METLRDFAKRIGVSESIARMWRFRHGLPVVRIGRSIYVHEPDYEAWLASNRHVAETAQQTKKYVLPKAVARTANKMRKIY